MTRNVMAAEAEEMPDWQLVQGVREGSMHALGVLYERHSGMLYRTAYRFLGSREEAEEAVQDLFTGLRTALGRYGEQGQFPAWARRIVVRIALDRSRSRSREQRAAVLLRSAAITAEAPGHVADALALQRALVTLPDTLREVFLLRETEGFSHQEIATLLGISTGTSMVRLTRAKQRLRRILR